MESIALRLTRFTVLKPARLSKRFTLAGDTLVKESGGNLQDGIAERLTVSDLAGFAALLPMLTPKQALGYGINGHDRARVIPQDAQASGGDLPIINRTRDHFAWPQGPGLMMLDYDPAPDAPPLDMDAVRAALAVACPALADAPAVWRPSSSSCIYHGDMLLRGISGQRLYIPVTDAADIPRAGAVLFDRLWLAGFGRYELSKSGVCLARSVIDASVFQPERLDFAGGAAVGRGLEQRLPDPILLNATAPYLDTRAALPDLDASERHHLAEVREALKEPLKDRQREIREAWISARVQAGLAHLPETDREPARPRLEQTYRNAAEGARLTADFELTVVKKGTQARKTVTVGALLKARAEYHEAATLDPLEPDYPDGQARLVGWLNLRAREPYLQSQAHGGTQYFLFFESLTGETFFKASQASLSSQSITYSITSGVKSITSITIRPLVTPDEKGKAILVESKAAEAVAEALRGLFAYCREAGRWYAFAGTHWQALSSPATVEEVLAQLLYGQVPSGFKARTLAAIASLLTKGLLPLPDAAATNGRTIPFTNGLLEPTTRTLTSITPQNALTWCLPYAYDPAADCPGIKNFLLRAVTIDQPEQDEKPEDLLEFLRAWFAAILTGRADLQRYLHLLGHGGTGKGTLIRLQMALVGPQNGTVTDLKNLEQNRFETAKLYGKRLLAVTDSGRYGGGIDVFKALTGQDPLRLEEKHRQQGTTFTFDGMVVLASNEPLQFSDFTGAVERRRMTLEFNRRVTDAERAAWDRDGGETAVLHQEIPGLVNWALALSRDEVTALIQRQPSQVRRANRAALEVTNPIAGWLLANVWPDINGKMRMGIAEKVQVTQTGADLSKESVTRYRNADIWAYANYCTWCAQTNQLPVSCHRFKGLVIDLAQTLGAPAYHSHDNEGAYIQGLRLRAASDPPTADPWKSDACDACDGKHHSQPVENYESDACDALGQTFLHTHNESAKNNDGGKEYF